MVSVFHHHIGEIEQGLPRAAIADPQALVTADQIVLRETRAQQRHTQDGAHFPLHANC